MADVGVISPSSPDFWRIHHATAASQLGLALDGVQIWYDACRHCGKDNEPVGNDGWKDFSGHDRRALPRTDASGAARPRWQRDGINGRPALRFFPGVHPPDPSTAGDVLVASQACPRARTVAVVVQFCSVGDCRMVVSQLKDGADVDFSLRLMQSGMRKGDLFQGGSGLGGQHRLDEQDWAWPDGRSLWLNGDRHARTWSGFPTTPVAMVAACGHDVDGFLLQLSSRFNGDRGLDGCVGEVLLWDRELSDAEACVVNAYLRAKWLEPLALPTTPPSALAVATASSDAAAAATAAATPATPASSDAEAVCEEGPLYVAVCEEGPGNMTEYCFASEGEARAATSLYWSSWVLFRASPPAPRGAGWEELAYGGVGIVFGAAATIRRHVQAKSAAVPLPPAPARMVTVSVNGGPADVAGVLQVHGRLVAERAAGWDADPSLAQPLREAAERLEATRPAADARRAGGELSGGAAEAGARAEAEANAANAADEGAVRCVAEAGEGPAGEEPAASALPPAELSSEWSVRSKLAEALAPSDDGECMRRLVSLTQRVSGDAGADALIDALVATLESTPPEDSEMVRLRGLAARCEREGAMGLESYAVASIWLACLYVRTERCIEARAKLTACVLRMGAQERAALRRRAGALVRTALPDLLAHLAHLRGECERIERDVGVQEISVRAAKGVSAGLSILGSAMVFTPLLPVGVGLLASGAGVGITTAVGDGIGQQAQKNDLRRGLDRLSSLEAEALGLLDDLSSTCFPHVGEEDWAAARGERGRGRPTRALRRGRAGGERAGVGAVPPGAFACASLSLRTPRPPQGRASRSRRCGPRRLATPCSPWGARPRAPRRAWRVGSGSTSRPSPSPS